MKKLLVLLLALPLSGCMWQSVDGLELAAVVEGCKDNGGVREVSSFYDGEVSGWCGNGEYIKSAYIKSYVLGATPTLQLLPTGE